jgi:hypothetical protein
MWLSVGRGSDSLVIHNARPTNVKIRLAHSPEELAFLEDARHNLLEAWVAALSLRSGTILPYHDVEESANHLVNRWHAWVGGA